jgi:outer membrane protein
LRATDEQVPQALANWRPTVAFTGQVGFTASAESVAQSPTVYTHGKPSSLDLSLTQQLYSGGRTEAQTRQAINTVEATRAQTLAVETAVFQAVAQAYFDWCAIKPWSRSRATTNMRSPKNSKRPGSAP